MIVAGPDNPAFRTIRGILYAWIAVLVLAILPYTEDPATPVKELATATAMLAMTLIWARALRSGRAPYRAMSIALWYYPAFFGLLGLSALFSGAAPRSLNALAPWIMFALMGFIAYQVCPHAAHLRNLFRVIVASVAASSMYGLAQYSGLDPFPWALREVEEYRALPATYGNPNLAGHAIVIALTLCAGLTADAWQRKRRLEFAVLLGAAALLIVHLRLTGMRGGPVALTFALLFVAAFLIASRGRRSRTAACARALAACAVLFAVGALAILALAPGLGLDSSLQLRLHGYAGAAAMFLDHAFLGVGPGNYAFHNILYWSDFEALWYALEGRRNFHAHNEWLEAAAEGGIPGIAILVGLFLFALFAFFENPYAIAERHHALALAIPAALVAVATDACFGFNLHAPVSAALFFLLLPLRPARPHYSGPIRRNVRRASLWLCLAALGAAWMTWRDFQYELRYQRAQGAIAWAGNPLQPGGGEIAAHNADAAFSLLAHLETQRPWDYRAPMLHGDFAMRQGRFTEALSAYEHAIAIHPHLPRLQIEYARASIRAAQAGSPDQSAGLDRAELYALYARDRCTELGEAWAMLGWIFFVRSENGGTGEDAALAVSHFEAARARGLSTDAGIDAALGRLHARLGAWPESADAYARSVSTDPGDGGRWQAWNEAAVRAGGPALLQFRQALLFHLNHHLEGGEKSGISPETAVHIAAYLTALPRNAAETLVSERVMARAVDVQPAVDAFWAGWLGCLDTSLRREALLARLAQQRQQDTGTLPPLLAELGAALGGPDSDTLTGAARTLAQSIATPPGGDALSGGALYAPLVTLLDEARREADLPEATIAAALLDLGAAYFETGDAARAEDLLRAAEDTLPAGERARAQYYRSRALARLSQPDAALALAKAAMEADGGVIEYQWNLALRLTEAGHADAARFLYQSLRSTLSADHPYQARLHREQSALPTPGAAP